MSPDETTWSTLSVWAYEQAALYAFTGERRLAMLLLWRSGQTLPRVWFMRKTHEVRDRAAVDWTGFPELQAYTA